jgi:hypothetical protein
MLKKYFFFSKNRLKKKHFSKVVGILKVVVTSSWEKRSLINS